MINVIAQFEVKPALSAQFIELCQQLIQQTQQEEGCISYHLQQNTEQANHFVFIEQWKSKDALNLHFSTPHFTSIVPQLVALSEKDPIVQTFVKVE